MTDAERQRRHRGRTKLCKYCNRPGQRLNGLGYASENEEPKQLYVCKRCLFEALDLYKSHRADLVYEQMA
jgi:hypothetical protein